MNTCPFCQEKILPRATICKHCRSPIEIGPDDVLLEAPGTYHTGPLSLKSVKIRVTRREIHIKPYFNIISSPTTVAVSDLASLSRKSFSIRLVKTTGIVLNLKDGTKYTLEVAVKDDFLPLLEEIIESRDKKVSSANKELNLPAQNEETKDSDYAVRIAETANPLGDEAPEQALQIKVASGVRTQGTVEEPITQNTNKSSSLSEQPGKGYSDAESNSTSQLKLKISSDHKIHNESKTEEGIIEGTRKNLDNDVCIEGRSQNKNFNLGKVVAASFLGLIAVLVIGQMPRWNEESERMRKLDEATKIQMEQNRAIENAKRYEEEQKRKEEEAKRAELERAERNLYQQRMREQELQAEAERRAKTTTMRVLVGNPFDIQEGYDLYEGVIISPMYGAVVIRAPHGYRSISIGESQELKLYDEGNSVYPVKTVNTFTGAVFWTTTVRRTFTIVQ